MKVKKACYMRSLTALLRLSNPKNSSDSNEEREPWYTTVPSITYIWTRRPQWRRRHKNRKKVKSIPVTFISSGANEDEKRYFWETLRHQERPCSRSSTSPYETCSSRQILTESELVRNSGSQRNRELLMSKKKNHFANRKVLVCETHSDSGLQNLRGTKLLGLSRSQKRLGVGNFANSQNTVGTLSSLEVNRSVQLLVCKALQSENSIPKRRVTFSNYVSENSVTDTRSQISSIIMNDNETSDTSWSRRSYVRLTDDEDNCSMQTDLSCLISSIIFDDSKTSFFSLTSEKSSKQHKKSNTNLNSEFNGTFFYVNSSYSNGSSCNLLPLSNNFSNDDFKKTNRSSLINQDCSNVSDFGTKILKEKLSQSSLQFNEIVPLFKIPENVTTQTIYRPTSYIVDDVKKEFEEKRKQLSLSNDIVSVFKTQEKITNKTMCSRNTRIVDVIKKKIDEKLSQSSLSNEIAPVIKRPDDVMTNTTYRRIEHADDFVRQQWRKNRFETNKMVTDIRIANETNPKLTSSYAPCVVDVMKNKLEDNLSQSNNIIPAKTPEDITTGSMYNRTLFIVDAMKKQFEEKLSPTNDINPLFEIPKDITTESLCSQTPHTNNFVKNKWKENFIESNQIVFDIIKAKEAETENTNGRASYKVDVTNKKLEGNLSQSSPLSDINSLLISTKPMFTCNPDDFAKIQRKENFVESNKIVSDTNKAEETKTELTYNRTSYTCDVINKKLEENLSQSNPTNYINPVIQTSEDITTRLMYTRTSNLDDFLKNRCTENLVELNKKNIDTIKDGEIKTELTYNRTSYTSDVMIKNLEGNLSQSNPTNYINPVIQTSEDIATRLMYTHTPHPDDLLKNRCTENLIESNKKNIDTIKNGETKTVIKCSLNQSCRSTEIVPVFTKTEDIIIEPVYYRSRLTDDFVENQWKDNRNESNQIVSDIEMPANIQFDSKNNSIECITIELKDISSSVKEIVIESRIGSDNGDYASMLKNDISTDTSDLIVVNHIPSPDSKSQLVDNDVDNGILNIREIFNFLQQPAEALDASLLFKELTTVENQPFQNYNAINELSSVSRKKSKENVKEIVDQVELFRIDTETCGEYESVFIEMKDFCDDFGKNEILDKKSSLQFRNCFQQPCGSLARNLNGSSKHSEIVGSSTSHFHNRYPNCSAGGKCCLVCGRRKIDNSRYIRPVCRVKGGTWSPHSEKDPWMNVIKKVIKYDNHMELIPQVCMIPKNEEISKDEELTEKSSKNSVTNVHQQNTLNEIQTDIEKKLENIVKNEEKEEECSSVIIAEAEEPSLSIPPVETNIPSSRADQSTSCCPPELHSSTSFGFATLRGPRTQSAKTYFMRESVRTVRGTANRLLCVISESDSLMAVPPFLPKKPPNWFFRQMPTRRCLRR